MEKRYNKGYMENCEIIHAERINNTDEVVMGRAETSLGTVYVTWLYCNGNYIWGHYFHNDPDGAWADFDERVKKEMRYYA